MLRLKLVSKLTFYVLVVYNLIQRGRQKLAKSGKTKPAIIGVDALYRRTINITRHSLCRPLWPRSSKESTSEPCSPLVYVTRHTHMHAQYASTLTSTHTHSHTYTRTHARTHTHTHTHTYTPHAITQCKNLTLYSSMHGPFVLHGTYYVLYYLSKQRFITAH